ncbi:unnamed protein product [Paramecium octaurelia]|uniref:Uncharacterized protein n=1 Tax=Paramecium octaurelia TaxID=43137 RepID=A0A8S1XWV0_PAROT|nr:unnamed protein product [Paramecium octaurelia]
MIYSPDREFMHRFESAPESSCLQAHPNSKDLQRL